MPGKKDDAPLKEKIEAQMTIEAPNVLEDNFELANQFIKVTKYGKVEVQNKDKISNKDAILLYLIGKRYANAAGYSDTDYAGNRELMDELGSVYSDLQELQEEDSIEQIKRGPLTYHRISLTLVEPTLKHIKERVK
ncbi:MAG: hypothetical protein GWO20_12760 [Candidatus Korarchaeota archaeon]|nr:hypothetical protein [Candidatus Korarchaeota archaeon]NIU84033.1 hypothetical protein [Candidatus Thorarchaeota archaeon]NIW52276.1 hypothetical protein [Candidatus Korarchaeota archaeon]